MKLNRLLVTNYLKKIFITIISLSVFLFPVLAFASDSDSEQAPLEVEEAPFYAPDLDMSRIMEAAQDIKAAAATSYTTDDIYNLLYAALRGSSSSTTYSLPYIANRLNLTYNILASSNFGISKTYDLLNNFNSKFDIRFDTFLSRANDYFLLWNDPNAADLSGVLTTIMNNTEFSTSNRQYSLAELTGMIWSLVQDISSDTTSLYSIANNTSSVKSSVDNLLNINWDSSGITYEGTSSTLGGSYLSSSTNSDELFFVYTVTGLPQNTSIVRLTLPFRFNSVQPLTSKNVLLTQISSGSSDSPTLYSIPEFYIESANGCTYLYLLNFRLSPGTYTFKVSGTPILRYINSFPHTADSIPFNNVHYQLIKTAFESQQTNDKLDTVIYNTGKLFDIDSDIQSLSVPVQDLANYLVSPEKQAAETASEPVIDETLDGFTGSGSAAAKVSDTVSMKNLSGSLQTGLSGGGSVSNSTDVLNPSSVAGRQLWIWFTTRTKENVENPYPAPVINLNTRKGSSGDDIIDSLSQNQQMLQELLRGASDD